MTDRGHLFKAAAVWLYLALQLDEEGNTRECLHPQGVTQCGVTSHLKQTLIANIMLLETQVHPGVIVQYRSENKIQEQKVRDEEFRYSAPTSRQKWTMSVTWGTMMDTSLSMSSLNTSIASLAWSCVDTGNANNLTDIFPLNTLHWQYTHQCFNM